MRSAHSPETEKDRTFTAGIRLETPAEHAHIAREDDEGVLGEAERVKAVENAADVGAHGGDGGEVTLEGVAAAHLWNDSAVTDHVGVVVFAAADWKAEPMRKTVLGREAVADYSVAAKRWG